MTSRPTDAKMLARLQAIHPQRDVDADALAWAISRIESAESPECICLQLLEGDRQARESEREKIAAWLETVYLPPGYTLKYMSYRIRNGEHTR